MRTQACRTFGLLDGMILVAAMAVWFAAMRHLGARTNLRSIWHLGDYGLIRILHNQVGLLLFILSLATLLIRFRSPRSSCRRLWRQPGLAACAAAVLGVAVNALRTAVSYHAALRSWDYFDMQVFWNGWPLSGPAVLGAWLALIVTGRWRGESSGIDRLGRLLGACWLIEFLLAEMPGTRWIVILGKLLSEVMR